jgi:hypothetical protein
MPQLYAFINNGAKEKRKKEAKKRGEGETKSGGEVRKMSSEEGEEKFLLWCVPALKWNRKL